MTRLLTLVWAFLFGSAVLVAHADPPPRAPIAVRHTLVESAAEPQGAVNLNEATADELEVLPGIGPARARAIIEHRRSHPFHKIDELTKVKGIGRKTFGRLRPYIAVSGPTTLRSEARR